MVIIKGLAPLLKGRDSQSQKIKLNCTQLTKPPNDSERLMWQDNSRNRVDLEPTLLPWEACHSKVTEVGAVRTAVLTLHIPDKEHNISKQTIRTKDKLVKT